MNHNHSETDDSASEESMEDKIIKIYVLKEKFKFKHNLLGVLLSIMESQVQLKYEVIRKRLRKDPSLNSSSSFFLLFQLYYNFLYNLKVRDLGILN